MMCVCVEDCVCESVLVMSRNITFWAFGALQGNGDGEGEKQLPQAASSNWTKSLARIASDNFLPLGMIVAVYL